MSELEYMLMDMQQQLDKSPQNRDLRMVMSDLLLEIGLVEEANCQRWLAGHGKHPIFIDSEASWIWGTDQNLNCVDPTRTEDWRYFDCCLPHHLFSELLSLDTWTVWKLYVTRIQAELALASVLWEDVSDSKSGSFV